MAEDEMLERIERLERFYSLVAPRMTAEAIVSNFAWVCITDQMEDPIAFITDACAGMIETAKGTDLSDVAAGGDRMAFAALLVAETEKRCQSIIDIIEQAVARRGLRA